MCTLLIDGVVKLVAYVGENDPNVKDPGKRSARAPRKKKKKAVSLKKAESKALEIFMGEVTNTSAMYEEIYDDLGVEPIHRPFRVPNERDKRENRHRGGSPRNSGRKPRNHVKFLYHAV